MAILYGRFLRGEYGHCPRALCDKQSVVPHGMSDKLREGRTKVFCPKCEEVYIPNKKIELDGGFFGRSTAHMFLK